MNKRSAEVTDLGALSKDYGFSVSISAAGNGSRIFSVGWLCDDLSAEFTHSFFPLLYTHPFVMELHHFFHQNDFTLSPLLESELDNITCFGYGVLANVIQAEALGFALSCWWEPFCHHLNKLRLATGGWVINLETWRKISTILGKSLDMWMRLS